MSQAMGKLIIICGLPGSGKTTYARQLQARLQGVRLSADEWMEALSINLWDEPQRARVEGLQWQLAQQLLPLNVTVIIEWGTWGRSERDALRLRVHELRAAVELHYLKAPIDVLFDRVRRRGMEDPPATRDQFEQWARIFQEPNAEEMALFDHAVTIEN